MVVVDLGGGLPVVGAEDPAGVLQEASLLRDGRRASGLGSVLVAAPKLTRFTVAKGV